MAVSDAENARALWFRVDLRLDDNPSLIVACEGAISLLPVYVFDPCKFIDTTYAGARKSSARRARFLLESLANLRCQLEARGSGLVVAMGDCAELIPSLCRGASVVCVTKAVCSEEIAEETRVKTALQPTARLHRSWGGMLYYPDECGCIPTKAPLFFSTFRKRAEVFGKIREPLEVPSRLPPLPFIEANHDQGLKFMPSLADLGFEEDEVIAATFDDPRSVLNFCGGEEQAKARVQTWIWDDDHLQEYKLTRNGMKGESYSSKFSPWLALGCLSPRRVWKEVQQYENERTKNKSTYWLVFELIWRDYFAYMGLGHGDKIFQKGGIVGHGKRTWAGSMHDLERWKAGTTGDLLVDANMRELLATGWMSNRGRQNVASYLIHNLRVDWRYGAAHFEEHCLDYDPCSNWGNWVTAAGLVSRQSSRRFNTRYQLDRYDPNREYVKHWLPDDIEFHMKDVHTVGLSGSEDDSADSEQGSVEYQDDMSKAKESKTKKTANAVSSSKNKSKRR